MYICICMWVCVCVYRWREKERFLPYSIVFITKVTRSKFLFHLNDMESFPKLYSAMVVRKYVKASSECVFQVWKNQSQQLYWGSLTLWKYMETWERSYIAKTSNVTLKAGSWCCYLGGFCLSLNVSSCTNSSDENCMRRSKRTVLHKGIFLVCF